MIGYTPAELAIRASQGKPSGTGADQPPAWHDQPFQGASGAGQPGNPMQPTDPAETGLLYGNAGTSTWPEAAR